MIKGFLSFIGIFVGLFALAQPKCYSLTECLNYVQNSTIISSAKASQNSDRVGINIAKDSFIPSITFNNQNNLSTGRVLDPTTYQFVTNRTVYDMSASVGASVTLFSGLERIHQVRKAELIHQSAGLEVDRTKRDLELEVIRLFLEILLDKEAISIYENKIRLLEKQEEMIAKKVDYFAATTGDLLNVQADITAARIECSAALSELSMDKVEICELLEIDDWESFDVIFDETDSLEPRLWIVDDIILKAHELPQVLQKEVSLQRAKQEVQIVSASYWPTIRLNAGYGSTFSNARVKSTGDDYVFYDQFRDNMSSYVTLSLSIPILGALSVSHTVKARKYDEEACKLELQRTLLSIDKEVKQAIVLANTAYDKYQLLAKEVEKSSEALRQTEAKYDAGVVTYYDYQIAVGNLFLAQAERVKARYEYIYRTKILDYYSGGALN